MHEWNQKSGRPPVITLAADASVGPTDYCDDQIWELSLGGGDPPAIGLQTTYGLRARAMRLFPRFTENDLSSSDPASFPVPPVIERLYPNFAALAYSPLADIDVRAEYWVPHSQGIAGRINLTNRSQNLRMLRLEWVGLLSPTEGQRLAPVEIQAAPVLAGQTGGLAPVVFLTGGPQVGSGPYPALALEVELEPGGSRQVIWSQAALHTIEESFALARSLAARRWDAERARVELQHAAWVEIHTGEPEWDIAFALSQKLACGLFIGPTASLPSASFVTTRQPDQGYSLRGDGTDYNYQWNGQSPLEAYYLSSLVLPAAPALAQGLVRNYLAVQAEGGVIDWRPGLAGQRSRLMATPCIASLAWKIYEGSRDRKFIEGVFPGLLNFVHTWFAPEHDRDGDGIPEWDHPMQAGADDHPLYSRWRPWAEGVEITTAETPALCSFMAGECQALIQMAGLLGRKETIPALQALEDHLRTAIEGAWDDQDRSYHDWDRDAHVSTPGEWLGQRQGAGVILVHRTFPAPVRPLLRVETGNESTRRPLVFIHGTGAGGNHRIERLGDERCKWYMGRGSLTADTVYTHIEQIEVQGIDPEDQVSLYTANYRTLEHSLLLPLWAGIPAPERAKILVENTLAEPARFWHPYGIPACPQPPEGAGPDETQKVSMIWNELIGEGLLEYGFRTEAAELVTHLMAAAVASLNKEGAFRRYYDSHSGAGEGERNSLEGLAPIGLFLKTLGVGLISPRQVALAGFSPFPWPVTVKYRGMTILRQKEKTMVIFPDGQTVVVEDPAPRIVSLEMEPR